MSVPPLLAIAVQYYYQERQLPPWRQDELFKVASVLEQLSPTFGAKYFFELFIPLAERLRGGAELEQQILRETIPLFSPLDFPFGDHNFYSLTRAEQLYYTQSVDEDEMLQRMAVYREYADDYLNTLSAERRRLSPWKDFTHSTLLSGHSVYLCSEEQLLRPLIVEKEVYPFDRGDLHHLLAREVNPYTGNLLPYSYVLYLEDEKNNWRQQLSFYSLDEVLRGLFGLQSWCPLRITKQYYTSVTPLEANDPFTTKILKHPIYNPVPWYPYYVYQKEEDTGRAQLVLDPYRKPYSTVREKWLEDREVLNAIADFHDPQTPGFRQIPRQLWTRLQALHFKDSQPVRLYRGMRNDTSFPFSRRGDSFDLSSQSVQSWTTSFCVAQNYAGLWGSKGVVVSTIMKPEDILIDSRYIATEQLRATVDVMRTWNGSLPFPRSIIFLPAQVEVLSKPGTYKVVVESISRQGFTNYTYPLSYTHFRSDILTDTYPET